MVAHRVPHMPATVEWNEGMVLDEEHFQLTAARSSSLTHMAALMADPWPWGFVTASVDEPALARSELRVECDGVFPDGTPFATTRLAASLPDGEDGDECRHHVSRERDTDILSLQPGSGAPAENSLPITSLSIRGGAWSHSEDWSPPMLLVGRGHPLRADVSRRLGALAELSSGFEATLRRPGTENRPVARVLGQIAVLLAQGLGVMEAMLASPALVPGRLGIEALRLALALRGAVGIFRPLRGPIWSPGDQRASIRNLLNIAESAVSAIGLPYRAAVFRPSDVPCVSVVEVVPGTLLFAVKASGPDELIAARDWLEGAALAAPDRIQEALNRGVEGCPRHLMDRDATTGVSSGPLIALYRVDDDFAWRAGQQQLALGAKSPPPENVSFSILFPETGVHGALA